MCMCRRNKTLSATSMPMRKTGISMPPSSRAGNRSNSTGQDSFRTSYRLRPGEKVPRTEANYRVTDGSIAAIDFGTTSVSLAYTTRGDKVVNMFKLDDKEKANRVPNAVLLKKEGNNVSVTQFGTMARFGFTGMRPSQYKEYIYFERIKMLMKREELDRQTVVESFSGEKFYLLEVIAFILKYLKDLLIDHLSRTAKPLKTTDFDWVITVPAIWDARGKRMMREAAYLAGLLTECDGITQFTPVSGRSLPLPNETNPDKLSLALEPESAAIYSQEMVGQDILDAGSKAAIDRPKHYMVIDIGGGTVDITAHEEVRGGGINVINIPTGNAWGGTQINEAFSKLLQEIVDDPKFEKFLASGDHYSQLMAVLNKVLYIEFEGQKVTFGHCKSDEIAINLSGKFGKFYEKALEVGSKKMHGVEMDDDMLYIEKHLVESKLFGPTLDGIISCTLKAIKDSRFRVNTFYLVGGFGGSKYVHQKVTAAIKKQIGSNCKVLVPTAPELAVAQGAAMWRKNPEKVKARTADATYGIAVAAIFDPARHDTHYRFQDDEKKDRCSSLFNVFLEKGELAHVNEVITTDLAPSKQSNVQMYITIYSTTNEGVQYILNKTGMSTVTKIGQLVIDIPNPDNLPREQRLVDITMDFSGTEIQAKAKYRVTGKEVKTVCDFLSAAQ